MNRLINKKYIANIGALIGAGLSTYVIHKQFLKEYKKSDHYQLESLIRELHSKSSDIDMVKNYQIQKLFGPGLALIVYSEILERFKPECKSFSVNNF
jgi:hypothetical protein